MEIGPRVHRRRLRGSGSVAFAACFWLCATYVCGLSFLSAQTSRLCRRHCMLPLLTFSEKALAEENFNPLKLKGYFWETGKFYDKENPDAESEDIKQILSDLNETLSILLPLESTVPEGNFEELKTKLRGANFSESLLRIRGKQVSWCYSLIKLFFFVGTRAKRV